MYEEFFGLAEEPFRLTPDPRYLFLSSKHAEALAHLKLGLNESSGFVCITGDVGTGKTTLLRAFLAELGPNVSAAYTYVPPLSALELLRRVCREFRLPVGNQSQGELVDELHAYLVAQREAGHTCVLILDEAQALSVELLEQVRLLLNLETETQKLLRIVLVGQPQLRKLLLDPDLAQLNQRITLRWHLGPLSYRETAAYVRHRLAVAGGGRAANLFTYPALRLLHSVAGGIPRLVNMVGHRALLTAFVARQPQVTRRVVARAYHEIQAVPLPGTLTTARKAAVAAAGLVIGATLVALGGPQLDGLLSGTPPVAAPIGPAQEAPAAAAGAAVPAVPVEYASVAPADGASIAAVQQPGTEAAATVGDQTPLGADDLTRRLRQVAADASARSATDTILRVWGSRPLAADEAGLPDKIEAVAWRRGLQELPIRGNRSMLRLLDLPAVLVLKVPDAVERRYVTLTGVDGTRVAVSIDGATAIVEGELFDRYWTGEAYVFWRDFEALGSEVLKSGARGVGVVRLQRLLARAGSFQGEPSGVFDAATEAGVREFQRVHRLDVDGLVGPFTRIALYSAAGRYERPSLGPAEERPS